MPDWFPKLALAVMLYAGIACPCASAAVSAEADAGHGHHAMHDDGTGAPPASGCGGEADAGYCFSSPVTSSRSTPAPDAPDNPFGDLPPALLLPRFADAAAADRHRYERPSHGPPRARPSPMTFKDRLDE